VSYALQHSPSTFHRVLTTSQRRDEIDWAARYQPLAATISRPPQHGIDPAIPYVPGFCRFSYIKDKEGVTRPANNRPWLQWPCEFPPDALRFPDVEYLMPCQVKSPPGYHPEYLQNGVFGFTRTVPCRCDRWLGVCACTDDFVRN
jgi:hypothetical protein